MDHALQFYIGGDWVDPAVPATRDVIDPATETAFATIAMGSAADVDKAVAAARAAFPAFAATSLAERLALLGRIETLLAERLDVFGAAISREMGAPLAMACREQAGIGVAHFRETIRALKAFSFERMQGSTRIVHEPIGVVAMITPWNWPLNQIACKVAPALAVGCTMVLKPSEIAPLDAVLFAEVLHEAGVPPGVFNLVQGDGPAVGQVLASHPDVDMVSFTGSTRAGVIVAKAAADTVKRVHQELGGKSPNIILPGACLEDAVARGVRAVVDNSGQSCNAPTRMLVPADRMNEALAVARATAEAIRVGPPDADGTDIGPVVSELQFSRIQSLIDAAIGEGAPLVAGGPGRPAGLNRGYYVRPTVFGPVAATMRIAREEVFGPVLVIIGYDSLDEAVAIANDTPYGLAAYVQGDPAEARALAGRLRAGTVRLNRAAWDGAAPFGGYKQSGNGREYGAFGLEAFLEVKGIVGWGEGDAA